MRAAVTVADDASLPRRAAAAGYIAAVAAVGTCTIVSAVATPHIGLGNADALYLLAVVAVALRWGRGPSVLAALVGVLSFDYFIVPPAFGFVPEDAASLVTFAVMLAVALAVSMLGTRWREQAALASRRLARMTALYHFAADLGGTSDVRAAARVVEEHLRAHAGPAVVLMRDAEGELRRVGPAGASAPGDAGERTGGAGRTAESRILRIPLCTATAEVGMLEIAPDCPARFALDDERRHLEAFASQAAIALERARLAEAVLQARLDADQERLRNTLLRSVSHDLRSPVAAIRGASSTLLQGGASLDAETRLQLVRSIDEVSQQLARQIHNLLEVTRLESGIVRPCLEWTPLDEVVGAALSTLEDRLRLRKLRVDIPGELPPLPLDGLLVQQVVLNLVDNALRHTPAASPIDVAARRSGEEVLLEVSDRGPGVLPGDEDHVFAKFHRTDRDGHAGGAGLGLAIARAIVQLHRGRIWVEPRNGGGATFVTAFPCTSPDLAHPPPSAATAGDPR